MPKLLAAILGGTLIAFSPEMLEITFRYADTANHPIVVYAVLCIVMLLLVGMISFYMWVGHKSRPSGFEELLKHLGRSMGNDKGGESPNRSSEESSKKGA